MYVCVCAGITDADVIETIKDGANTMGDLQEELGVATCCGRCKEMCCHLLDKHADQSIDPEIRHEIVIHQHVA